MLQSSENIGTDHTPDHLSTSNDNNDVLTQEANELCEEIGELVDSIYTNFTAQENVDYNDAQFGAKSYNFCSNEAMSNFSCCKNSTHCNVLANELMRKQIEKEKLVYCNDKLDEIRGMLESFGEPERTDKRNGSAWEIDDNYLQQFQLKMNVKNQQEIIKNKLSKANKLKLSDYYKIHFSKSRANTSPDFNMVNGNDGVQSRMMTSPWSSKVTSNHSVPTRVDTTMSHNTHNTGNNGQVNGMSGIRNYVTSSSKVFSQSQRSSRSMLNNNVSDSVQNCYTSQGPSNLYRTNMVGTCNNDGSMMYVRGTMKLNSNAPQNGAFCSGFARFNANKHKKPMMSRETMSGLSVPYAVGPRANYGFCGRTNAPSYDFGKINHSNSASTCYSNSYYGEDDPALISSIGTEDDDSAVVRASCMGLSSAGGASGNCMGFSTAGGASGGLFRGCFSANVGTTTNTREFDDDIISNVNIGTTAGPGRSSSRMGVATTGARSMSQMGSRTMDTTSFGAVGGSKKMGTSAFEDPRRKVGKVNEVGSGMSVCATSGYGANSADNNTNTSNKEESQYYEFETIDDLMEYENDEYYCDSMGPLPQLTNSNDELLDKLFEGNEPNTGSTPLAVPYLKGGLVTTPTNTRATTNGNNANYTLNNSTNYPSSPTGGPRNTGSRFAVDREVNGGEISDDGDGTTGEEEDEEEEGSEPEDASFEDSSADSAEVLRFSRCKPEGKGTVKVGRAAGREDTVYKARVICPNVQ
ncbi:conserved hypothetical protein [Theileria orientalis strain Shintoku]|uniref:Uncharacterized protein n=1 Tax=Theileria orientalis strain Shintoku TaxID=869250 RepID=J4CD41_THEOR|nr:conserved hypothetical protein [Theileria orientalis strain Shintoku]PVC51248.1 hypothetical protein MACL_00001681 [Theileria orientalis]BAM40482.1 conserved hypothetical protein [Theileria orientalis strain Shintoku]|eukprot:XP_009690783.1 conserved hypothetical protein [Theileria orientalis strain Shintoku]